MGETKKKNKKTPNPAASADKPTSGKGKGKSAGSAPLALITAARAAAFIDEAPARAFAHFRPLAETVATADLPVFTGQPLVMRANILAALAAVEPHLAAAVSALREPRLEAIFELPSLVMALDFAVGRVPVAKLSAGEIEKMLAEGAPWRELMLSFLEVAAHPSLGFLPRERVAAVRAGRGKLDQAQDLVALPGLFAEFGPALSGKHPVPADNLDLLSTLGGTLQNVRLGNAIAEIAKRSRESILRDQLSAAKTLWPSARRNAGGRPRRKRMAELTSRPITAREETKEPLLLNTMITPTSPRHPVLPTALACSMIASTPFHDGPRGTLTTAFPSPATDAASRCVSRKLAVEVMLTTRELQHAGRHGDHNRIAGKPEKSRRRNSTLAIICWRAPAAPLTT